MTFSAAGLVLHYRTEEALRATKIYLFMSIMGEVMVLAALLLIAAHANTLNIREAVVMIPGSPYESVIIGLVIFGFGVKAGLFMMHLWLPLAHSVAPVPASAILSGSMLKAGLLGWIMFLPGSVSVYPFWGSLMIFLGIVGALYCAVMGMMQQNPKTNLAYSSASQMGLMTLCIGLGLSCGVEWVDAVWIVSVYAMNHALAKGALFMGVGVVLSEQVRLRTQRIYPVMIGLILLSLSISGLPYTGGGLAKRSLKHLAHHVQNGWSSALDGLLLLSTVMTALLLSRLVYLLYLHCKDHCEQVEEKSTLLLVWLVNVAVATLFVWLGIYHFGLPVSTEIFSGMDWLKSGVPIAVAVSLFLFVCLKGRKVMPLVPTGDVVCFFEKIAVYIKFIWVEFFSKPFDNANNSLDGWVNRWVPEDGKKDKIVKIEQVARNFQISGFVLMAIIILFVISFLL
jgi:formate hydrogenlyase subunit 3/multisubunit Na+/H+ antiporter MnhD subunit